MKLYLMELINYKEYYVLADDTTTAEKKLLDFLNKHGRYFYQNRRITKTHVLGDETNGESPVFRKIQ